MALETALLIVSIIEFIAILLILFCVFTISIRVRGKIGNKTILWAFFILGLAAFSKLLRELEILKTNSYFLIAEKAAFTIFLILMIAYFCGIHKEINGIANGKLKSNSKRKKKAKR